MIPVNVLPPFATKFELQLRSLVIVEFFFCWRMGGLGFLLALATTQITWSSFAGGRGILKDLYGGKFVRSKCLIGLLGWEIEHVNKIICWFEAHVSRSWWNKSCTPYAYAS
ncbi:hypothetical protein Dsin_019488 [Dipteronia sinensis]|uniref:Uncharacterized protein n=1 Tax=Dipteronia sinensis TaxID=43782 RepID=A0AAE0A7A8_9ROSI|nr:hypothetical protein Dsin_019488 [Dipteronia sinensis]